MKFGVAVVPKRVRTACEKCANWALLADGESNDPANAALLLFWLSFKLIDRRFSGGPSVRRSARYVRCSQPEGKAVDEVVSVSVRFSFCSRSWAEEENRERD